MSDEHGGRVRIETSSRVYNRLDGAFLEQVDDLRRSLTAHGIGVTEQGRSGTKGGAEIGSVIETLVMGGAGLTTLCGVVKVWLRHRGDRLARLTFRMGDGAEVTATLEGRNVSDDSLLQFAKDVAEHLK